MGGREVEESSRSRKVVNLSVRRKWLKTKEKWLVVVGVVLLVSPRFPAPAKRLVLLVADGLRADKFFESDAAGKFRAPFLRSVIKERGRWGVSHARPPAAD
ncbi:hypothetical protein ABKV19_013653 [Rosa sericea]